MIRTALFSTLLMVVCQLGAQSPAPVGQFENHLDVGTVLHPGSAVYDPASKKYTISGSGENMWFASDAFHFAFKKASGDIAISADVVFEGRSGNAHRKAVLMIRQSLDADSAYADVALHADGLTSLQYRDEKGVNTHEVQANVKGPLRLRLERRGEYVYMLLGNDGDDVKLAGGSARIRFQEPFYVGLGVCSHDKDAIAKAVFSNVEIGVPPQPAGGKPVLYSTLETVAISSTDRRVVRVFP